MSTKPYSGSIASAEKTPITIWKVLKENKDDGSFSFVFNHIEDGWNATNNQPTPKTKYQKSVWKNQVWAGIYGWLIKDGDRLVVEPFS